MMGSPPYDTKAPKQAVSLTINSDLYAQSNGLGINASQVAEEALAREVARRKTEQLAAEIRQEIEAIDAYEAKHGSQTKPTRTDRSHDPQARCSAVAPRAQPATLRGGARLVAEMVRQHYHRDEG